MLKIFFDHSEICVDFIGCDNLSEVKHLSAANLKLTECVSVEYFPAIEEINIAHNQIQTITGPKNIHLRHLECNHNQISNVYFLEHFPSLVDLEIHENPLLSDDYYLAVSLCPNLKTLNKKSVAYIRGLIQSFEEKLWNELIYVWKKEFSHKYSRDLDTIQFAELRQEFENELAELELITDENQKNIQNHLASKLVTKLMIDVRHNRPVSQKLNGNIRNKGSGEIVSERRSNWLFQSKTSLSSLLPPLHDFMMQKNNTLLQITKVEDNHYTELGKNQVLLKMDDLRDIRVQSSQKIKYSSNHDVLDSGVSSNTPESSTNSTGINLQLSSPQRSLRIRIKCPSEDTEPNPNQVNHLINEILTSPQKLTVKLTKLKDAEWKLKSPSPTGKSRVAERTKETRMAKRNQENGGHVVFESPGKAGIRCSPRSISKLVSSPKENYRLRTPKSVTRDSSKKESTSNSKRRNDEMPQQSEATGCEQLASVKRKLKLEDVVQGSLSELSPLKKLRPRAQEAVTKENDLLNGSKNDQAFKENGGCGSKNFASQGNGLSSLETVNLGTQLQSDERMSTAEILIRQRNLLSNTLPFFIKLPELGEWEPTKFFRCHSPKSDCSDSKTQVWSCAFEPHLKHSGTTTSLVATCGGQTVCFTDCSTGRVLYRYKCCEVKEAFYSLAWTTLTLDGQPQKKANILAVAGRLGVIHLVYANQMRCCAVIEAHKNISALEFHPEDSSILCSGGAHGKIMLWEIGEPTLPDFKISWSQLQVLNASCDVLNIVFAVEHNLMIAGCESGCFAWKLSKHKGKSMSKSMIKFRHPEVKENDKEPAVDSIALITDDIIASKCTGHGCIYLWNLKTTLATKKIEKDVFALDLTATLLWNSKESFYINFRAAAAPGILVCGDTEGQLWVYNISELLSLKSNNFSNKFWGPSSIISWPECKLRVNGHLQTFPLDEVTINDVCVSCDGVNIVAVTDKNLVCLWQMP